MSDTDQIEPTESTSQFEIDETNDSPTRHLFKLLSNQVAEIDSKLDAGSVSAGKQKIRNELVTKFETNWKPVATNINDELTKIVQADELDMFVGSYFGLIRTVSAAFKEQAEKYVEQLFETQPTPEDVPSDEEKKALASDRSELTKKIKTLQEMAVMFQEASGEDDPNWVLPKRRGAVGKRGKRALTFFEWRIDGEEFEDNDSVKGVSDKLEMTRGDFTAALRNAGVDTKEPKDTFTVEVKGHQVTGTRMSDEETTEEDETTEETEEEEVE